MGKTGRVLITLVIVVLIGSNVVFAYKYFDTQKQLAQMKEIASKQALNVKILDFAGLFVDKVLKATTEVSFNDRLQLENTVRSLNDQDILDAWGTFVNSTSQDEAQSAVKNLLGILVKEARVN